MTMAYDPRLDWAREDAALLAGRLDLMPIYGPLVDGDLCEIEHCRKDAVIEFIDNRGCSWLACGRHSDQLSDQTRTLAQSQHSVW